MDEVPKVDQERGPDSLDQKFEELQLRSIDADARARENLNREADQRYHLRYWAVVVASLLILLFIMFAIHVLLNITDFLDGTGSPLLIVGLYIPPITAAVALSVSLLVAAFRGAKDSDTDAAAQAGINGAKIGSMIS